MASATTWGAIHEDMNYVGHDLTGQFDFPPSSATADGCFPLCEADQRCSGFTWVDGACWLKFGNPDLVPLPGSRSAALVQQDQCLPLERDVDYWGNDITCIDGLTTPDDCCAACGRTAGCHLYVVDNAHCCLKSASADRRPDQDPALNIRAAFLRSSADGPGVPVTDDAYSLDVRANPVSFSSILGAQWLSGIVSRTTGVTELASIVTTVNASIATQPHSGAPKLKAINASDGATVLGFWSIKSIGECAAIVSLHGGTLFTYSPQVAMCLSHQYPESDNNPTYFMSADGSFTSVPQALSAIYQLDVVAAADQNACQSTCTLRAYCAAIQFDGQQCTLFAPAQGKTGGVVAPDSSAGWVTTPFSTNVDPSLPAYDNHPSRVVFYTTAHQDDHELFMSNNYHAGIADPTTKVVFVYTSAGDAGEGQRWRLARQLGTVAASTVWVDHVGRYNTQPVQDTVQVAGHDITRVNVGNVAHYFLCIREDDGVDEAGAFQYGLAELLYGSHAVPPMDQPTAVYVDRAAFRDVLQGIFDVESNGVGAVEIHGQAQENENDHPLHTGTGNLIEEIVGDTKFGACALQVYYYDYDVWTMDVNLNSPVYELQRYAWMAQSQTILDFWGDQNWSVHSDNLGRTYPRRTIPASVDSCN
ncbi:Aste57867_8739 [Aphanomyces stellatus]|uniref:Aste57867_8739 protein n=1 Tax=Aphanomyces stellatus TaxID=120398 RepID=A0A485KL11_9STRA|nr:hypothetical protein As57867_008705 [Aphanomyces stellatus]VFT85625.1 Aste57867_8739 [Aphanomyces stellatus]